MQPDPDRLHPARGTDHPKPRQAGIATHEPCPHRVMAMARTRRPWRLSWSQSGDGLAVRGCAGTSSPQPAHRVALTATDRARARALDRDRGRCVPLGWIPDRPARGPHRRRSLPDRLGIVSLALWASAPRAGRDAGGTGGARAVVISDGDHARRGSDAVAAADAAVFSGGLAAILDRPILHRAAGYRDSHAGDADGDHGGCRRGLSMDRARNP